MCVDEAVLLAVVRPGGIDDGVLAGAAHRAADALQAVHMAVRARRSKQYRRIKGGLLNKELIGMWRGSHMARTEQFREPGN